MFLTSRAAECFASHGEEMDGEDGQTGEENREFCMEWQHGGVRYGRAMICMALNANSMILKSICDLTKGKYSCCRMG